MKRLIVFILLVVSSLGVFAQQSKLQRPKLVVGLVLDQMRWDYLYRYYDRYGSDGFRRLMGEGYNCQNAFINYLPAFTGPGHATIYTGSVPSIHGIASNDWMDIGTCKMWYCTEDPAVRSTGGSSRAGQMSPRNLLTSTITDELRLATNMRSRVYGVAIKDRGSILPAGHLANGAYWFDDSTGNFISSSYYGEALPEWVNNFNNKRWADSFLHEDWELLDDISSYTNSIRDNNAFEGRFAGETSTAFPHSTKGVKNRGYYPLRYMPGGNTITMKMAKACIRDEQLGQVGNTDFLCVSLSTTDYAGHMYAPNSVEMEDMFMRLDEDIASFLRYMDKYVGEGNYLLFLTADHGGAHNAEYLKSLNMPAGNAAEHDVYARLDKYLKEVFKKDSLVLHLMNYQVYLNEAGIEKGKLDREEVKAAIVKWMQQQPEVAYAVDMEDMDDAVIPEPIRTMIVNGYNSKRSGVIQIIMQPAWYSGYGPTGTTHGTWHPYDTHIPLIWYGWHVRKGENFDTVHMTDIAPTIAAMLHLQMPNGCVGRVIEEVIKK